MAANKKIPNSYILLVLFLCACMVFFASCSAFEEGVVSAELPLGPQSVWNEWPQPSDQGGATGAEYSAKGVLTSDTGTHLNLMAAWETEQTTDSPAVDFSIKIYLVYHKTLSLPEKTGNQLIIDGQTVEFAVDAHTSYPESASPLLLYSYKTKIAREAGQERDLQIAVEYQFDAEYEGYYFDALKAQTTICLSEKYAAMPESCEIPFEVVRQYPELPNGCEVTSLAMVLGHLGFTVSKVALKNDYLPIGEADFYRWNIGDPSHYSSYGCYSPVIAETARQYLRAQNSAHEVKDLTHFCIDEIYFQLSEGRPVMVWVTQDLNVQPYITDCWQSDGTEYRWKAPLHCVVLIGYDQKASTVTLADPLYGIVERDMELFETRWHQMGEQAVMID